MGLEKEQIKNMLKKSKSHTVGDAKDILPFLTKKTGAIKGDFNKVLGNYIRNICELELDEKAMKQDEFVYDEEDNELSHHIAASVDFGNDDDNQRDFVRFLNEYLFNEEDIKLIHPHLFNFIENDKRNKNEFSKYGRFMKNVLANNNNKLKSIFTNKDADDILTELVLTRLDVTKNKKLNGSDYSSLLQPLSDLYQSDVIFLSNYKDYFLESFPLLTHYYVFMYACQLVIKFEQFTSANYEQLHPLYFSLEWEPLSKRRKPAGNLDSYKYIKENHRKLFPHIHTLSQLSHNSYNRNQNSNGDKLEFMTYTQIDKLVEEREIDGEQFYTDLKKHIANYIEWAQIDHLDHSENLDEAFKELYSCLEKGTNIQVSKKFGSNIDDLGSAQFIKSRGSLGYVLNIKHDFLLLLTAVSVKNQRIPLNDLFDEFKKRGIVLDRYSKQELVQLFNKLNIIDKKSDSGDAQYVKPIL